MRRAIGYIRISPDDGPRLSAGSDVQRHGITAFIAGQGWTLAELVEDVCKSSAHSIYDLGPDGAPLLPGLLRAIRSLEVREVDVLVVFALDRIGPSLAFYGPVWERIDRTDAFFCSVTEPALAVREVRDLIRGIFTDSTAHARKSNLVKTRDGRQAKLAAGGVVGRVPYGYRIIGVRRTARVEVVEERAAVVRRIYSQRAEGQSLASIALALNLTKIPGPAGGSWHPRTIQRILVNPAYRGKLRWRERIDANGDVLWHGVYPAIINVGL